MEIPGHLSQKASSVRDTGQGLQFRDYPGRSGTVGTYVSSYGTYHVITYWRNTEWYARALVCIGPVAQPTMIKNFPLSVKTMVFSTCKKQHILHFALPGLNPPTIAKELEKEK